jgi:hypothetical protein
MAKAMTRSKSRKRAAQSRRPTARDARAAGARRARKSEDNRRDSRTRSGPVRLAATPRRAATVRGRSRKKKVAQTRASRKNPAVRRQIERERLRRPA